MTSKNLYSKLMREDLKGRLWAVALIGLVFFFAYPVVAAFEAGPLKDAEFYEKALLEYAKQMETWLSFSNGMTVFLMMVTALVCGMSSFSYLNSRSKVDFYHSIPVRRERLFAANYLNGILIPAVPYALAVVLATVIAISNGVSGAVLWPVALSGFGLTMVYYILMYSIVVVAAMLTGNLVVGVLGTAVFSFYIPLVVVVTEGMYSMFFKTYVYWFQESFMSNLLRISPLMEYIYQVEQYGDTGFNLLAVAGALAVSVLFAIIACVLYGKRPSEAAGRAMAFPVSKPIIRIMITVLSGIGFGLFFWAMRISTGWAVFGVLCGGIIAHCVIEIIYHFDFKKLLCNKLQLAACLAVSLLVMLTFRYDWFGYDRYLPKEDQVKEVAINLRSLNSWISYGKTIRQEDGSYEWESTGDANYVFEHMHGEDTETALALAKAGIDKATEEKESGRSPYKFQSVRSSDGNPVTTIMLQYTLNSGRKVYRRYWLVIADHMELFEALNGSEQYKNGTYPIMKQLPEQVAQVRYREGEGFQPEVLLDEMTVEEKTALLTAYQQDFQELTLKQMEEELPVGLIRFVLQEDAEGMLWWEEQEATAKQNNRSFYNYGNIFEANFYPVYPSFQRTNQILAKYGIKSGSFLDGVEIKTIDVEYRIPDEGNYEVERAVIDNPIEIQALMELLKNRRISYYNPLFLIEEDWQIDITFIDSKAKLQSVSMCIPKGQVPDFVKDQLTKESD